MGAATSSGHFHEQKLLNRHGQLIGVFNVPTRYSDFRYINEGSQGIVASALDSVSGKRVAIKKMTRPFGDVLAAKRSYRELMLLSNVRHSNIIRLFSAFTPQRNPREFKEIYLVTELMEYNLNGVIEHGALTFTMLSFTVYQLLRGVHHLHELGIIHRDLKPSNVAVNCSEFVLKLLDFGLARMKEVELKMTECVVTRYYRAPEVILGLRYDEKVDVWSIGCILAEMMNRQILFAGRDDSHQWREIVARLGTPSEEYINRLPEGVAQFVRSLPRVQPTKFNQLVPDPGHITAGEHANHTASAARHLLSRMLTIDATKRFTVEEALAHPFVRVWSTEDDAEKEKVEMENSTQPEFLYDHDLESYEKNVEEWRGIVFTELKKLEETHNIFTSVRLQA